MSTPRPGPGAQAAPPQLEPWKPPRVEAWRQALSVCAARVRAHPRKPGAACVLRTVTEHLRQPWPGPYRSFVARVAPLAAAAGVPLLEQFEGTWAGSQAGLLRHHDSTRIHFSDTGRAYLAQLTLNALPLILRATNSTVPLPQVERANAIHLDRTVPPVASSSQGGHAPIALPRRGRRRWSRA